MTFISLMSVSRAEGGGSNCACHVVTEPDTGLGFIGRAMLLRPPPLRYLHDKLAAMSIPCVALTYSFVQTKQIIVTLYKEC